MSKTVYDKNGKTTILSEQGDVQNYPFLTFDVYGKYGMTDPIEGLKKIYQEIPRGDVRPRFVWLGCGSQYLAIVQAADNKYGSAIVFGYSTTNINYIRLVNGVWY